MRGQAHTLEAVVAGLVVLSSVLFALQATAVTPLSASTSSQHIENQQQALAEGVLQRTAETGTLRRALLFWGNEDGDAEREFHCANANVTYSSSTDLSACSLGPGGQFASETPPNAFGAALNETFGPGVAVNVEVDYVKSGGTVDTQTMVQRGKPSDNAVRASTTVTLFDDDPQLDSSGDPTGNDISSGAAAYFAPNRPGPVYNVLRVEVTVWRI